MNTEKVFEINKNCVIQTVDEGSVILRLSDGQIYSCNETSQRFIQVLDGSRKLVDVIQLFRQDYAIDESTATKDLSELARELLSEGVICETT